MIAMHRDLSLSKLAWKGKLILHFFFVTSEIETVSKKKMNLGESLNMPGDLR